MYVPVRVTQMGVLARVELHAVASPGHLADGRRLVNGGAELDAVQHQGEEVHERYVEKTVRIIVKRRGISSVPAMPFHKTKP